MTRSLTLLLAALPLRGRALGVTLRSENGTLALTDARPGLAGLRGTQLDGDPALVPWSEVVKLEWGPEVEAAVDRARRRNRDGRAMRARPDDGPGPALSPEEIAEVMDGMGRPRS